MVRNTYLFEYSSDIDPRTEKGQVSEFVRLKPGRYGDAMSSLAIKSAGIAQHRSK